ncbi:histone deacetylase family protein [Natranaerofaba carboxydovora]|uniref:histone deacetylase family protein n=1 Tax=Natranaerofaba carboxydovora TaxID=2742683 RepID=UPI001F13DB2B|nr:hypothetical protein [Natranaerofaba carboxydovora]UMZ74082.1 Acetylpolyamine aminohydrolase [Natranaerofaba carboxydovora]
MKIVYTEKTLDYGVIGHPDSPERVQKAHEYLKDLDIYEFVKPEPANEEDIKLVHTKDIFEKVKKGNFFDPDCPVYENLFEQALLSAGGAIKAQELQGFSLMRPPGHHAGEGAIGGFCYFNNLAIAVKKSGLKTLIVDFDGHHGNGTEDIFHGDENVYFLSLHRAIGFPGTGKKSRDNIINYPIGNCDDDEYIELLKEGLSKVEDIEFEQIAVSAGFDAHERDPLASLGLSTEVYKEIGEIIAEYNLPTFAVLEGGYIGDDLGKNIDSFLKGLTKNSP